MLLDTSGLLNIVLKSERNHQLACELYDAAIKRLTHGYVLAEFIALSQARGVDRVAALDFADDIVADPDVEVVWVDENLHREGMTLLRARLDKTYSLCDAVSFVLMRRFGMDEALTNDRHFEQEGFRKLLT